MVRKGFMILSILLLSAVIIAPNAFAAKKFIRMVTGPEGGSWYPLGAGMMKIVQQNVPGVSTKSGPGGGVGNCKDVDAGRADLGWSYTHTTYNAYNGKGKFKKKLTKVRHLMSLYPGVFQIAVPKKSDITDIGQLADKRIVPGKVGFTGTAIAEIVFKGYGITFKSIKAKGGSVSYVGYSEMKAKTPRDRILFFRKKSSIDQLSPAQRCYTAVRNAATLRLTGVCEITEAKKALMIVTGPPDELNMEGFSHAKSWLENSIATSEVRGGD